MHLLKETVLFSGGSDSTLTAYMMCNKYKEVHLVSYSHSYDKYIEKTAINVKKLKERFDSVKILHKIIDVENIWMEIYRKKWKEDRKKYGDYIVACGCGFCKLAMHTRTICYNLGDHIKYFVDGANKESGVTLPTQMEEGILIFKNLYSKYNIDYYNPIYNEVRTDKICYELGLSNKKEKKFPQEYIFHETDPSCWNGSLHNIYVRYYFIPKFGIKKHKENAKKYINDKLLIAEEWINRYFQNKDKYIKLLIKKLRNVHIHLNIIRTLFKKQ